jgi:hypothetical protein
MRVPGAFFGGGAVSAIVRPGLTKYPILWYIDLNRTAVREEHFVKTIKVQALTEKAFAFYGSFQDMLRPQGPHLGKEPCTFFRDMAVQSLGLYTRVAFSVTRIIPAELLVRESEFHNQCEEMLMPIDGDILIHLGQAGRERP